METLSWLCLFLPLAGVVVLALAGNRIGREPASWLATAIAFASFICGAAVFFSILGEGESARSHVYTLYTWAGANNIQRAPRAAVDPGRPAVRGRDADRVRRGRADRHVLDRLHARRPQAAALLRLHEPVPVLDAAAGDGRQLRAAAGRLGPGRPLVLPADRVLARAGGAGRRRQEGLRDERDRRRRHRHRDLLHGARHRHHRLPRGVHTRARCVAEGQLRRQLGGAAAAGWALSPNRPRSRSTPGFRTPWRAPPRSVP